MADETVNVTTPPATPPQPDDSAPLSSLIPEQYAPPYSPDSQPPQPQSGPDLATTIPTIPSETAPNNVDIERQYHESMWRRALDRAGSILGGDTTIHITKDADGNVTMTHDPSTTGEKWGRVAQAALTGAAAGLANSQGPGGLARAAAAGIKTGTQLPQQREQQAQQSVDFSNKQLLATANRMHVTQATYLATQQAKLTNLQLDQESADVMNKQLTALASSPNAVNLGTIDPSDPNATSKAAAKNPQAMQAYLGKGDKVLRVLPTPDHKLNLVMTDKAWEDRLNDTEEEVPYVGTDGKGNPVLKTRTIQPQTDTNGNIQTHWGAALKQFYDFKSSNAKANKDEQAADNPAPKTPTEASFAYTATHSPDPAERAKARQSLNLMKEKPGTGTEELSGFDPQQSLQTNAEMMVDGLSSPSLMSKRAKDYNQLLPLAQAYSMKQYGQQFDAEISEARYQARKEVLKEFAGGKPADQIQSFQAFTNHAQDLLNDTANFRTTNVKLLNTPYNAIRTAAGSADVTAVKTHIEALRREYLNFLSNNMALKGDEIKEGRGIMDDNSSPAQIETAVKSFMQTAIGRVSALNNRALRFNVPIGGSILTPANEQTIRNLGLGDYASQMIRPQPQDPRMFQGGQQQQQPPQVGSGTSPAPQPQTPPAPTAAGIKIPPIPQGHTPQVNYVQGSDKKFYWIEPEQMARARQIDKNLQVIPR